MVLEGLEVGGEIAAQQFAAALVAYLGGDEQVLALEAVAGSVEQPHAGPRHRQALGAAFRDQAERAAQITVADCRSLGQLQQRTVDLLVVA